MLLQPLTVLPVYLDFLIEPRYLVAIIADKGKPVERPGRKGAGPRQTDQGRDVGSGRREGRSAQDSRTAEEEGSAVFLWSSHAIG